MERKLTLFSRIGVVLCAALIILVGGVIILGSLQFSQITISGEGEGFFTLTRLLMLAGGAVTILIGLYFITLPRRLRGSRNTYVQQKMDAGEMRISVQAIEAIVRKCLSEHDEIRLQSLSVQNVRGGVVVSLKASLAENVSIPLAVAAIQKHVRKHLLATGGIDAKDVRVSVVNSESAVASSPYLIKPEEMSLPRETDKPAANDQPTQTKDGAL